MSENDKSRIAFEKNADPGTDGTFIIRHYSKAYCEDHLGYLKHRRTKAVMSRKPELVQGYETWVITVTMEGVRVLRVEEVLSSSTHRPEAYRVRLESRSQAMNFRSRLCLCRAEISLAGEGAVVEVAAHLGPFDFTADKAIRSQGRTHAVPRMLRALFRSFRHVKQIRRG